MIFKLLTCISGAEYIILTVKSLIGDYAISDSKFRLNLTTFHCIKDLFNSFGEWIRLELCALRTVHQLTRRKLTSSSNLVGHISFARIIIINRCAGCFSIRCRLPQSRQTCITLATNEKTAAVRFAGMSVNLHCTEKKNCTYNERGLLLCDCGHGLRFAR